MHDSQPDRLASRRAPQPGSADAQALGTQPGMQAADRAQWLLEAFEAFQSGRLETAARQCHRLLDASADHFEALHLLGLVCWKAGEPVEAVRHLSRAVALRPRNASSSSSCKRTRSTPSQS